MPRIKGTLQVAKRMIDARDRYCVYDVSFTPDNPSEYAADDERERVRRFYTEHELAEFLTKRLNRTADEAVRIVRELQRDGQQRVPGLEMEDYKLRGLNLAA